MAGGGIQINGDLLYNLRLIDLISYGEIYILRYDQFVHCFGFFVATLVVWNIIKGYFKKKVDYRIVYILIVTAGMGLGVLNEMIEFVATVVFPNTNVGGYVNNSLDLIFNTIGSIFAIIFIHLRGGIKNAEK